MVKKHRMTWVVSMITEQGSMIRLSLGGRWLIRFSDINQETSAYGYSVNNPISNVINLVYHRERHQSTSWAIHVFETALYHQRLMSLDRVHFKDRVRVEEARNFEEMVHNATVRRASMTIIKGRLLEKLKKDPAFQAWRKKILAYYKANLLIKKYSETMKLGGHPFFSTMAIRKLSFP
jgi:hypothetical protein